MKVKADDLTGLPLRWAVAKLAKGDVTAKAYLSWCKRMGGQGAHEWKLDLDAGQGMPLLFQAGVTLQCFWPSTPEKKTWQACIGMIPVFNHREPLIAGLRCLVAKEIGEELEVPDALLQMAE